jgi:hypothetical protein
MVSIGQEAAVEICGACKFTFIYGYTVTKISPTGQITITNKDGDTRRFNKQGYELGKTLKWYDRNMVRFDIDAVHKQEFYMDRAIAAAQAINDINMINKPHKITRYYCKETMHAELDAIQRLNDEARKVGGLSKYAELNAIQQQIDEARKVVDLM